MKLDGNGRESRTLLLVTLAYLAIFIKFIIAGMELPIIGKMPLMTPTEFASSEAMIMGIWLGREWIKK